MASATAGTIINDVALEVGLRKVNDPVSDTDDAFTQLTGLLTIAGQELVELHPWQTLVKEHTFTTVVPGDTGIYDLPSDYACMVDQTQWDRTNDNSIGGPLSAQDWAYLSGRDLTSDSIYVKFRIKNEKLNLYPQPPPNGVTVAYEYVSRWWVQEDGQSAGNAESINNSNDTVLYEPILIKKFLKCKWLEAKGFDASAARLEFENMFLSRTAKDEGAPVLSAVGGARGFPYISPYFNVGDTNFGVS